MCTFVLSAAMLVKALTCIYGVQTLFVFLILCINQQTVSSKKSNHFFPLYSTLIDSTFSCSDYSILVKWDQLEEIVFCFGGQQKEMASSAIQLNRINKLFTEIASWQWVSRVTSVTWSLLNLGAWGQAAFTFIFIVEAPVWLFFGWFLSM